MARAREFLCPASGSKKRNAGAAYTVRFEGVDHRAGSLRLRGRNVSSRNLQLDGARLPVRERSGERLVSRAPTRRRGLKAALCSTTSNVPANQSSWLPPSFI